MKLSCVIPAHNESGCIERVINELILKLESRGIDYEIVVVDDNSCDGMAAVIDSVSCDNKRIKVVHRKERPGFGRAIKAGFERATGDAICIVMGDGSDDAEDVVRLFEKLQAGFDVVYGSRFIEDSKVYNYPPLKLKINRLANYFIRLLFCMNDEKDITNAFKIYRKEVIQSIKPIQSNEFNITLELPVKAELKGFKRIAVPVRWYGRESDVSKFSIFKMSKCYAGTLLKLWLIKINLRKN